MTRACRIARCSKPTDPRIWGGLSCAVYCAGHADEFEGSPEGTRAGVACLEQPETRAAAILVCALSDFRDRIDREAAR